jgi:predicted RNA-binding Zn-ribbon protein involved in translation (DUF1610 family)
LLGSTSFHILANYQQPLIGVLCSLIGFSRLNKSRKFKLWLVALIVCIVGFQFSEPSMTFYTNPFYIGGIVFAVAILINTLNYFCPQCKRNQVVLSLKRFKLPNNTCHNCGYTFGKNGIE